MSAAARPPEGGAPSLGEAAAQRQEGSSSSAPARPPEGGAPSLGEAAAQRQEGSSSSETPMAAGWDEARNVLCIRLDNMGDVLMTTPAMRALKGALPGRRLTLLASRSGAAIARHVPEIDEVIVYEAAWVKNAGSPPDTYHATVDRLRACRFDAAVIFTVYSQSALPAALMCHAAGIPRVLAYSRENPYHLISDWVREVEPLPEPRHEVQRQLDLVATIGVQAVDTGLSFRVDDADQEGLDRTLRAHGVALSHGWVLAHCGATAESRRYPTALFAQAIDMLAGAGERVILTGSPDERTLVDEVVARSCDPRRLANLAGALTLGEFGALVARARLLVSNNSGPVHIAAALGTPVVDLYALTNPQHTPWQVPHRLLYRDVPCKYCYRSVCPLGHHACLSAVDPSQVAQAAFELLESHARARPPIMIEAA